MPSAAAVTCQGGGARLTLAAQCVTRSVRHRLQPAAVTAGVKQSCGSGFSSARMEFVATRKFCSALILQL